MIITMKKTFDQDANDHNDINDYPKLHTIELKLLFTTQALKLMESC